MSTVNPPPAVAVSSGLKVTMIVFSAIGLAAWGTAIGFLYGWEGMRVMWVGVNLSILINVAMIYTACRLIFLVTNSSFPSTAGIEDLHQCVARMVAVTVVSLSAWGTSVAWLAQDGGYSDNIIVYHACNYGFVISAVVAGLAGGLLSQVRVTTKTTTGPVHAVNPIAPQPSQAHYNQAYMYHYGQQRV